MKSRIMYRSTTLANLLFNDFGLSLPTPQHHSRHRENIGRIGSLMVFWEMSVIAVFPLKTGDLMFVSSNVDLSKPQRFVKRLCIFGQRRE